MKTGRVLLHHPNESKGEAMRKVLEKAGHVVHHVTSGAEVAQALSSRPYTVLMCNFKSSQECIRLLLQVKSSHPEVGRMVMVNGPDRDFALQALALNLIHHFVVLPVAPDVLSDTVCELRDWARQRQELPDVPWAEPEPTPVPA